MEKQQAVKIFMDILETTPGIYSIQCPYNCENNNCGDCIIVSKNESSHSWDFTASITILKNSNLKNIVNSITTIVRFALRKQKQKLGKLNILVGGLNND